MAGNAIILTEMTFNILYLCTIWLITILMVRNIDRVDNENKPIAKKFYFAFGLLALGDTGHVGFRALAYLMGGLEENSLLVGMGALATAVTVTFFYMVVLDIWRLRFNEPKGLLWYFLIAVGVARLLLMVPPGNMWGEVVPPFDWSIYRNIPLMIQGIAAAILIYVHAFKSSDKIFKNVSYMIFISYLCYTPVILFVQKLPLIGMLMIPKTLAYVAIAIIAYKGLYTKEPISTTPISNL